MSLPQPRTFGDTEVVHAFERQMPTGVAVSDDGRVFVSYPRWGDDVRFTVAELRDGEEVAYGPSDLVSVQSVVVDPTGRRLWLLDAASIEMEPAEPGAPKLVCVDLGTDEVVQTIAFDSDVALETTYLGPSSTGSPSTRCSWARTASRSAPTASASSTARWPAAASTA